MPCPCSSSAPIRPQSVACGSPALSYASAGLSASAVIKRFGSPRVEMPRGPGSTSEQDVIPTSVTTGLTIPGDPSTLYDLQVRLRGAMECVLTHGGQSTLIGHSASGEEIYEVTNGAAPSTGNALTLTTSMPAVERILNAWHGNAAVSPIQKIDMQIIVQAYGGTRITLKNSNPSGRQTTNTGGAGAFVVAHGVPPAPSPFDGQFMQMDLVAICPAISPQDIPGPDTFHLPRALRFPTEALHWWVTSYGQAVKVVFRLVGGDPGTYTVQHNWPFQFVGERFSLEWTMRINEDGSIEHKVGSVFVSGADIEAVYGSLYLGTDGYPDGQFSPTTRSFWDLSLSSTVVETPPGLPVTAFSNVGRIPLVNSLDQYFDPGQIEYNDTTPTPRVIHYALFKRPINVIQD